MPPPPFPFKISRYATATDYIIHYAFYGAIELKVKIRVQYFKTEL